MNYEKEITKLNANVVGTQIVVVHVLGRLIWEHPEIAAAIRHGFDNAANQAESTVIQLGKSIPANFSVKTLGIIEEMRVATFGKPDNPKHIRE